MYSLFILIPLLGIIILNLPFLQSTMKRVAFWLVMAIAFLQIAVIVFPAFHYLSCQRDVFSGFFNFSLKPDNLSIIVLLCIGIILSVSLMVGRYIIKDPNRLFSFVNLLLVALVGMNAVVMVNDIFSLFVFLEVTAVTSFILIAFYKKIDALEGAFKYIILSACATVLMLSAIALVFLVSGSTSFSAISLTLKTSPHTFLIMSAIGLFLCGLFIKSGLIPFHGWLPDAYSASPAPVSIFLAGIVTKVVGVYSLIRVVVSVFGFDNSIRGVLLMVGAISIVLGAISALTQSDFKRMLAYSSISQIGYIILGLGSGNALGIAGAIFHFFNHAIFKSLLFVNSTAVEFQVGSRDMQKLSGLAQRMPVTGITSLLASFSAAGLPPLAGFWSKLLIIIALWSAGNYTYASIAILASLLTLAYFLRLQRMVFWGKLPEELSNIEEAGFGIVFPSILLAAVIVGVGVCFPFIAPFILALSKVGG